MDLYLHRIRQRPYLAGAVVALLLIVPVSVTFWWSRADVATVDLLPRAQALPESNPRVIAHAAGEVRNPGVYDLPAMSRVADLLEAAGGVLPGSDVDQLNLAALVADGDRIYVPAEGESVPVLGAAAASGPLNLNSATVEQLQSLSGVGPSTAAAIVSWRQENGAFGSLEDLLKVPGIGPAKLERISQDAEVR
ncbi:MAG: helix-hairpin-helix domain-containing protein [Acidimicrobiales bacterium]